MTKKFVLLLAALLFAGTLAAQKRVSGRVTDSDGQPVAGASVRVPGSKVVTTTDANGNFVLSGVPNGTKQLAVSFIGYEQKMVSVNDNMNIVLQESTIDEAVVIGYGTARKLGTVVGTVSKVGSDKIENKPVTMALEALQGKVAGVQILNSSGDVGDLSAVSTTIRGTGSLNGGTEPLFIVDGAATTSSIFYMLNQNDIESYTVLRGASATSIYGARAANGVIVVTTKRGKVNERAQIKVGQSIGWTYLGRRVGDPMNSRELLDYQLENGVITASEYAGYKKSGVNTDWKKYFFDNGVPMYNTTFSIAGGSGTTTYYTSGSYMKRSGLTPQSKYGRYTFRTNIESHPLDWFKFGINLGLSYDTRSSDNINGGSAYLTSGVLGTAMLAPYHNPYAEDGSRLLIVPGAGGDMDPYLYAKYNPSVANDARLQGSAFIEITPIKGLTIKSLLGTDLLDQRGTTKILPSIPSATTENEGYVNESFARSSTWQITNTAEYKWDVTDDHQLIFLLGHEGILGQSESFNSRTQGQSDDRFMELGHGTEPLLPSLSGHPKYEYLSFFGRVDYSFLHRYFVNFTIRNDRSSRFGIDKRSASFPSGGVKWDMKQEKFLRDVSWINVLNVVGEIGSVGNSSGIGNYTHLALVSPTTYGKTLALVQSNIGNKYLSWETQIMSNIGFNGRFFDRFNLEVNYYRRKTKDMLMDVPVPYTTGQGSYFTNIASLMNQGIEIMFDVDAVKNWHGLNINVYGNFTYNSEKITKLFNGLDHYVLAGTGTYYQVGKPVTFFEPKRAGIDPADGTIMWYVPDANGKATSAITKEYDEALLSVDLGKRVNAPINGGFGLRATWNGLELQADFVYVLGKYMLDNTEYFSNNSYFASAGYNQDRKQLNAWKKPGDITDVPRFGVDNEFDSSLIHNSSFMRLKNLSLSYDLPHKWMEATKFISNFRVFMAARNLFTITNWTGADPETDSNIGFTRYPNTKEFSIGAEITF
ncbi:MAG: SusC/RagA family TonB-linked outer membrane protein [Alloprevotella sp.]|nr:SusC/RagA family TonB-linked outer membrane protein [Alloprevotella sp.]